MTELISSFKACRMVAIQGMVGCANKVRDAEDPKWRGYWLGLWKAYAGERRHYTRLIWKMEQI